MTSQETHDQSFPVDDSYNLLDAENIYYVKAKGLLMLDNVYHFEFFIKSIAGLDEDFVLFDFLSLQEDKAKLKSIFYGHTDCAGDIATDVLEEYLDIIMDRIKSGDLNPLSLDY